mmetsp:Transcript_18505/g.31668  ORF Transcript_18505/g.31668 Transcript_18505/m.31668 type:complete len:346 (+) Transcript_18505:2135-3172(+)
MFRDEKEVEVRLTAVHGQFLYLVQAQAVPDLSPDFNAEEQDKWLGSEFFPTLLSLGKLRSELQHSILSDDASTLPIDFFVRVYPVIMGPEQEAHRGKELTSQFELAFYDEELIKPLRDGLPVRGYVTSQQTDYYELRGIDRAKNYEIQLNQISGGQPDLVLSFSPLNKFPTLESNDFKSDQQFSTDVIMITSEMLSLFNFSPTGAANDSLTAHIGVLTKDRESVYSLMITDRDGFNPIRVNVDQVHQGFADRLKKQYFYTLHAPNSQQPLRIDVSPDFGNPAVEVTIITDLTVSRQVWEHQSRRPDLTFDSQYGVETIVLDSLTLPSFYRDCAEACVVLVAVGES